MVSGFESRKAAHRATQRALVSKGDCRWRPRVPKEGVERDDGCLASLIGAACDCGWCGRVPVAVGRE